MTPCDFAPDILRDGRASSLAGLDHHLDQCAACAAFFAAHGEAFDSLFASEPLEDLAPLLDGALRRLETAEATHPTAPQAWPTVDIQGFTPELLLGETRLSRVYLARQHSLDRAVALKIVRLRPGSGSADTLKQEAATLASLRHSHIVTIHETGMWEQGFWLALEYCEGGDLLQRLRSPWPQHEAARLVRDIALAAHAAHQRGIIHRDIKPSNILFSADGLPKLGDFGLAGRAVELPSPADPPRLGVAGTPSYIAPEQALGHLCDARTDVHSLGAVLYHLLVGRSPYQGRDAFDSMVQAVHVAPPQPAEVDHRVSEDLNAVCMTCLRKEPDRRYASAGELARDLGRFLARKPVQARPLTRWQQIWHWIAREPTLAVAMGVVLGLLLASSASFALLSLWALGERAKALEESRRAEAGERLAAANQETAEARTHVNQVQRADFEWRFGSAKTAMDLLKASPFPRRGWVHHYLNTAMRENRIFLGQCGSDIRDLSLAPDAASLAVATEKGRLELWSTRTGALEETLLETGASLRGVCHSGNGDLLAVSGSDRFLRVRDNWARAWLAPIPTHPDHPTEFNRFGESIRLDAGGTRLFAEYREGQVGIWNPRTGELLKVLDPGIPGEIRALDLSPDQHLVAAAGKQITVWDTRTGRVVAQVPRLEHTVLALAFLPGNRRLASGDENNDIHFWDIATGQKAKTLAGHSDSLQELVVSPDGKVLASTGDDYTVRLWDASTGEPLRVLKGHFDSVRALAFAPDGQRLFSGGWDRDLRLWDLEAQDTPLLIRPAGRSRMSGHTADGRILINGPWSAETMPSADFRVTLWDCRTGRQLASLPGHVHRVHAIATDPAGRWFATGGQDKGIRIWSLPEGKPLHTLAGHGESIQGLCVSPDGTRLYSAANDGMVGVWDPASGTSLRMFRAHEGTVIGLATGPDGRQLATGCQDGGIRLWDTGTLEPAGTLQAHADQVRTLAFSPDGHWLASGDDGNSILIWEVAEGRVQRQLNGHTGGVTRVHFSPDGTRLASSSFDKTVRVWNPVDGAELLTLAHPVAVRSAQFGPDGQTLASSCDDGLIRVWRAQEKLDRFHLQSHTIGLVSIGFYGDPDHVMAKDTSGARVFWDIRNGALVQPQDLPFDPGISPPLNRVSLDGRWVVRVEGGRQAVLIDRELQAAIREKTARKLERWFGAKPARP